MILPDVNLLVYAYNSDAPRHARAREWWEDRLSSPSPAIGLSWAVVLGYVRIMTSRAVLVEPLAPGEAIGHVRAWLSRPHVQVLEPGPRHLDVMQALMDEGSATGSLTTDAHLAALAIEHRAELHSNDSDFSRFAALRWVNPLAQTRP